MKNSVKKIFITLCAVSVMAISVTAFAEPTSVPSSVSASSGVASSSASTSSIDSSGTASGDSSQEDARPVPTMVSTGQTQQSVVQSTEAQKASEKKYTSKGMSFFLFILTIIINAFVSFAIGNRFYKLAKKDSHVSAEIRALRRDLEEKFVNNVGGFSEMATDVVNTNDNYSENGSINMPEGKASDFAAESEDIFKKWESRMAKRPVKKAEPVRTETFEEEEAGAFTRKFQPVRKGQDIFAEDAEVIAEEIDLSDSKLQSVKDKAKSLLEDIFPFKED